jgi:hypothetical protein
MRQNLEIVKAPTDNRVTEPQENVTEEGIEMDKGVMVTETVTDEQIMGNVINPE